ncbi:FeoA family protein [Sulfurospirillum sp. 1612]|uniref:FeoA family protein n=1 Tax=Sulfurospirillum sp. 1612 TaxID=3094835 RepID=UPI002F921ECD
MKTVSDMKISEKAIIKKIIAKEPIKSRLFAMGIVKGAVIKVLEYTLAKQTWDIVSNNTKIALREEEARGIIIDE